MKTIYIEKMDKPIGLIPKIKIDQDNCQISVNLQKEKHIRKIINKLIKNQIQTVVLSRDLCENTSLKNALSANNIHIFDGRWLEKYLVIQILDYIAMKKNIQKEDCEIAVTVNQITDTVIKIIRILAKQYKRLTVVTTHFEKLKKIEKEIFEKEGILIIISNNQKKSLLKPQIILNMDFNKELINKYRINENAVIINIQGDIKIEEKRFNGLNINDYEIKIGREEVIWRPNMKNFRTKDLLESVLYMRDTYENICSKVNKNKVSIKELYGISGKIESFF